VRAVVEAAAPRVCCPVHEVVVAHVPWARQGAGHTRNFDDTAAWLAVRSSKTVVSQLLRVVWRTVGAIVTRVGDDALRRWIPCLGCAGSGSTRSPTSAATAI
jgi:transposase